MLWGRQAGRQNPKRRPGLNPYHLLPSWYPCLPDHQAEHEGVAEAMDQLHLKKINLADEIFVVNFGDYIGSSTKNEIEYAEKGSKTIRWFTHDPIGEKIMAIIDEAGKEAP